MTSFAFSKSSTGLVSDPKNGVLTYESLETLPDAWIELRFQPLF